VLGRNRSLAHIRNCGHNRGAAGAACSARVRPQVWEAFAASTQFTRAVVLEAGDPGWHKIQSMFSRVRMWGGSIAVAYVLQAAVTLAAGATVIWLWRSAAFFALKASALCCQPCWRRHTATTTT
jgi:hypothetical protein